MDAHGNYEIGDTIYVDMYGGFYAEVDERPVASPNPSNVWCRHLTVPKDMQRYHVGFLNGYGRKYCRIVTPNDRAWKRLHPWCPRCERHVTRMYDYICESCRLGTPA